MLFHAWANRILGAVGKYKNSRAYLGSAPPHSASHTRPLGIVVGLASRYSVLPAWSFGRESGFCLEFTKLIYLARFINVDLWTDFVNFPSSALSHWHSVPTSYQAFRETGNLPWGGTLLGIYLNRLLSYPIMTNYFLAFVLLVPCLSLAQKPFTYHISGRIGALNAPSKVYLTNGELVDSATLVNGVFELKGTAVLPTRADLVVHANGYHPTAVLTNATSVFLEPNPVVVISEGRLQDATTTITGGPLTTEHQQLYAAVPPKATPQQYAQAYTAFIKTHPTSWVSLMALWDMGIFVKRQYDEVAPLYAALSSELKSSRPGRIYGDLVQGLKATAVGQPAPTFTKKTPAGKSVSLADYRGKYVLLAFWSSCASCRTENPNLVNAYQAFKGPKFDMLGVSLDAENNRERWIKAIADDHLTWTQLSDFDGMKREVERLYGYPGTPLNLLIDPGGKIVAANLQGADLQATLAQFLK